MTMKRIGLTLTELLIVIVLFTVVLNITFWVFLIVLKEVTNHRDRLFFREEASYALDLMTRDLHEAREITSAKNESITFWWQDTDGDGLRDANELVTFSWSGTPGEALKRGDVVLAGSVETLTFSYRDLNKAVLSPDPDLSLVNRDSLRQIDIQFQLKKNDVDLTFLTTVYPRNLDQVRGPW